MIATDFEYVQPFNNGHNIFNKPFQVTYAVNHSLIWALARALTPLCNAHPKKHKKLITFLKNRDFSKTWQEPIYRQNLVDYT